MGKTDFMKILPEPLVDIGGHFLLRLYEIVLQGLNALLPFYHNPQLLFVGLTQVWKKTHNISSLGQIGGMFQEKILLGQYQRHGY